MLNRRIAACLLAGLILSFLFLPWGHDARGSERIMKKVEYERDFTGYYYFFVGNVAIDGGQGGNAKVSEDAKRRHQATARKKFEDNSFEVYTVTESKALVGAVKTELTALFTAQLASTKADLLKAVGEVGKKSLEDEQFKALKAALRQELQEEMRKEFKEELRKEIVTELKTDKAFRDELKKEILAQLRGEK